MAGEDDEEYLRSGLDDADNGSGPCVVDNEFAGDDAEHTPEHTAPRPYLW